MFSSNCDYYHSHKLPYRPIHLIVFTESVSIQIYCNTPKVASITSAASNKNVLVSGIPRMQFIGSWYSTSTPMRYPEPALAVGTFLLTLRNLCS